MVTDRTSSAGQVQIQVAMLASQQTLFDILAAVQVLVQAQQRDIGKDLPTSGGVESIPDTQLGLPVKGEDGIRSQDPFSRDPGTMGLVQRTPQYPRSYKVAHDRNEPVVPMYNKDFSSNLYRGSCREWCSCRCHRRLRCDAMACGISPLGFLSMLLSCGRYSLQACNEPRCLRRQDLKATLAYCFPPWLLAQAVCFMFTFSSLGKPKFTPRWSATLPGDAKVFTFAIEGDLEGLKRLFQEKAASPHDIAISTGRTALHVSILIAAW